MLFKVINNKLGFGKMNFNELPEETKKNIAPIETAIMYYDRKLDIVFINELDDNCERLEKLCSRYLAADKDIRETAKTKFKSSFTLEAARMLDEVMSIRESEGYKLRKLLGEQNLDVFMSVMEQLYDVNRVEDDSAMQMANAFQLGYIMGKREERSRRKKVQA